jgi:hypothetical protein
VTAPVVTIRITVGGTTSASRSTSSSSAPSLTQVSTSSLLRCYRRSLPDYLLLLSAQLLQKAPSCRET